MGVRPGYKQTEVGIIPEEWDVSTVGQQFSVQLGKSGSMPRGTSELRSLILETERSSGIGSILPAFQVFRHVSRGSTEIPPRKGRSLSWCEGAKSAGPLSGMRRSMSATTKRLFIGMRLR